MRRRCECLTVLTWLASGWECRLGGAQRPQFSVANRTQGKEEQCVAVGFHDGLLLIPWVSRGDPVPWSGLRLAAAACVGER